MSKLTSTVCVCSIFGLSIERVWPWFAADASCFREYSTIEIYMYKYVQVWIYECCAGGRALDESRAHLRCVRRARQSARLYVRPPTPLDALRFVLLPDVGSGSNSLITRCTHSFALVRARSSQVHSLSVVHCAHTHTHTHTHTLSLSLSLFCVFCGCCLCQFLLLTACAQQNAFHLITKPFSLCVESFNFSVWCDASDPRQIAPLWEFDRPTCSRLQIWMIAAGCCCCLYRPQLLSNCCFPVRVGRLRWFANWSEVQRGGRRGTAEVLSIIQLSIIVACNPLVTQPALTLQ